MKGQILDSFLAGWCQVEPRGAGGCNGTKPAAAKPAAAKPAAVKAEAVKADDSRPRKTITDQSTPRHDICQIFYTSIYSVYYTLTFSDDSNWSLLLLEV